MFNQGFKFKENEEVLDVIRKQNVSQKPKKYIDCLNLSINCGNLLSLEHRISTYRSLYFVCRLIVNNNNNNKTNKIFYKLAPLIIYFTNELFTF